MLNRQRGISLLEIMVVVAILSIIAVIALPNLSSSDSKKLDLAAAEVAQAIRFARIEAMRTGISYGVIFSTSSDEVKIYRLVSGIPTYDVVHPVTKKLYTLNLKTDPATSDVDLQSYAIYYGGGGVNQQYLGFNRHGNPKYHFFGLDYMLDSAAITLAYRGQTTVVHVGPMTGRVSIQ